MKKHVVPKFSLGITLLLLVSSCMPVSQPETPQPPTFTTTLLFASTVTPTTTPTLTITPTLVEVTPVNTMTSEEQKDFVKEFLPDSGDCRLPCWWGITPGQTWTEAEKTIQGFGGFTIPVFPGYDPETTVYGVGGLPVTENIYFENKQGLVYASHIESTGGVKDPYAFGHFWKNYSAQKIIKAYGMPDRILLNGVDTHSIYDRIYLLWLFYDELGFSILYEAGLPAYFYDTPFFRICSETDPLYNIYLDMQSPNSPLPLERFDRTFEQVRLGTDVGKVIVIRSLQEATGMSDDEIYEAFMQEKDPCLAIPSDIWRVK